MPDLLYTIKDRLVTAGLLTESHLKEALEKKEALGKPLDEVLVQLGFLLEEEMLTFLGETIGIPFTKLDQYAIDPVVVGRIPESVARTHQVLPLFLLGDQMTLAMVNPLDLEALEDIRHLTQCKIDRVLVSKGALTKAFDILYGSPDSLKKEVETLFGKPLDQIGQRGIEAGAGEQAPIIKLVELLILRALQSKASDIHFEPDEKFFRIRYRIDGSMREVLRLPKWIEGAIISRIKVLANLDITERRLPQDGRIGEQMEGRAIDLRVSVINTVVGEKVVIRILDKATAFLGLEALGFLPQMQEQFEAAVQKPNGIILVTGPTGSGKTSTLYSVLSKINTPDKNIITIEDPVEYHLEQVSQIQVDPKIKLSFSTGLRSIVRQDPDIIMVGEIRDRETADIAIHAALSGHLVFSTLHTNSAAGAVIRLGEMGVKPYLMASSLTAVLAQRLVRMICHYCRAKFTPTDEMVASVGLPAGESYHFFRGKGCRNCKGTGYRGRTGLFELLVINDPIRDLVLKQAPEGDIMAAGKQAGMVSFFEDGIAKIFTGVTTLEEIHRVTTQTE